MVARIRSFYVVNKPVGYTWTNTVGLVRDCPFSVGGAWGEGRGEIGRSSVTRTRVERSPSVRAVAADSRTSPAPARCPSHTPTHADRTAEPDRTGTCPQTPPPATRNVPASKPGFCGLHHKKIIRMKTIFF